jgi:hypothetical protein
MQKKIQGLLTLFILKQTEIIQQVVFLFYDFHILRRPFYELPWNFMCNMSKTKQKNKTKTLEGLIKKKKKLMKFPLILKQLKNNHAWLENSFRKRQRIFLISIFMLFFFVKVIALSFMLFVLVLWKLQKKIWRQRLWENFVKIYLPGMVE